MAMSANDEQPEAAPEGEQPASGATRAAEPAGDTAPAVAEEEVAPKDAGEAEPEKKPKDAPRDAWEAVARHASRAALVDLASEVTGRMFDGRARSPDAARAKERAAELGLDREGCATPFGNALDVLERGPEDDAERALAGALAAHAVLRTDPGDEAAPKVAARALWLAAHTPFDALAWLDRASEDKRPWAAIAEAVRDDELDRGARAVGCAALAAAADPRARNFARSAAAALEDPLLAALLAPSTAAAEPARFEGRVAAAPRRPWATVLLGITGLLLVAAIVRLVMRWVLSYETPGDAEVRDGSVVVRTKTRLLGRTLREREITLPKDGLASVTREVRFPSLVVYVGLVALAVGSAFGASLLVDGARAASPSLLGVGLAIVAAGAALDFVLTSVLPGARGKCRVVLVPRKGKPLCLELVDPKRADEALARLR